MTENSTSASYFPHVIQIDAHHWRSLGLGELSRQISERSIPDIIFYRQLALRINRRRPDNSLPVHAGQLNMYATLLKVFHHLIDDVAEKQVPEVLANAMQRAGYDPFGQTVERTAGEFSRLFPAGDAPPVTDILWRSSSKYRRVILREILLLRLAAENPALDSFREILDDSQLAATTLLYPKMVADMELALARTPLLPGLELTLAEALRAPITASPHSLSGQVGYIREHWNDLLPPELLEEVLISFDILLEEERSWGGAGEPGPPPVMEFGPAGKGGGAGAGGAGGFGGDDGSSVFGGYEYPEYEHFSADADWMSNVVLMAKMVYVWLDQLSLQVWAPHHTPGPDSGRGTRPPVGRGVHRPVADRHLGALAGLAADQADVRQSRGHLFRLFPLRLRRSPPIWAGEEALRQPEGTCLATRHPAGQRHGAQPYRHLFHVDHASIRTGLSSSTIPPSRLPASPAPISPPPATSASRSRTATGTGRDAAVVFKPDRPPHRPDPLHLPRQRRHPHPLERYGPAQLPDSRGARGGDPDDPPCGAAVSRSSASMPP